MSKEESDTRNKLNTGCCSLSSLALAARLGLLQWNIAGKSAEIANILFAYLQKRYYTTVSIEKEEQSIWHR
jgi:hypothetical protein